MHSLNMYSMPQLDKTAVYPEHMQYDTTTTPLVRSPVNKFGTVSGDILTSSAWSAIIHRPAEDSEPDELPSTVDMDAIKEPPTPLPAPVLTPKIEPPEVSAEESSSGSDSEGDSSSDTDTEEASGSGSWSSESECGSENKPPAHPSPCSSQSSDSDHSTHHNKHFSIRETNFDQGGLKLKISALKIPKKPVVREEESSSSSSSDERDNSSSDEEADKSSDASQGSIKLPRKQIAEPVKMKEQTVPVKVNMEVPKDEDDKKKKIVTEEIKDVINKTSKAVLEDKPAKSLTNSSKIVKEETRTSVRGSARLANLRSDSKSNKTPVKVNNRTCDSNKNNRATKSVTPTKGTDKMSSTQQNNTGRQRNFRRRTRPTVEQDKPIKVISGAGADSCDSDDEEDDETDGREGERDNRGRSGDDITQLAQQLGEPETAIPISEQLQEINQEDLAAILPDVVGFDGFEDVSSGEGRGAANKAGAAARPGTVTAGQESSSDMELLPEQEQIVSEAIKRIDLDSEGHGDEEDARHLSSASGEEDEHEEVGYSSSLLQQFVEKTEQLTQKTQKAGGEVIGQQPRRRRGRPPKHSVSAPPNQHQNQRLVMPELESYMRLDCSVSNVSPDSGIQSVAGSPSHQCSPAWHPPPHSPAPPPVEHLPPHPDKPKQHSDKISKLYATTVDLLGEIGGKRGPGRPKGSGRRKRRRLINPELLLNKEELRHARDVLKVPPFYRHGQHNKTVVNMVEHNDDLPRLPGMVPGKRGPGRPKKTPPTLEPILPLGSNKSRRPVVGDSNHKNSGSLLHDICERVSKRLDIPLPLARMPCSPSGHKTSLSESKLQRVKPLAASLDKRKKGRRKVMLHSRSLALSKGLMKVRQHKHKKRKKMKKNVNITHPRFVIDIDKLIQDFNKMCRVNTEASVKTVDNSPLLPSIFRVKRIVKKRKGSERDRDSGPEVEAAKEKILTHNSSSSNTTTPSVVKRRPKKSTVEATKNRDRPEANNEQRLPLKKRHYHMSAAPAVQSAEPAISPKPDSNVDQTKVPSTKSVLVNVSEKAGDKDKNHIATACKSGNISTKVIPGTLVGKVEGKAKVDVHRNSIDEVIEATITRYSHESRSVIVTPKKRHRMEMEKKGPGTSPVVRNLSASKTESASGASPQPTKRVSSRSSSTNNQPVTRASSPSPMISQIKRSTSRGPRQRSASRGPIETQPTTKKANTRSSDKKPMKTGVTSETPCVTSATQAVLNKRAVAREKAAQTTPTPLLQHVGLLSTRSAAKILPNAPLITPIPPPPPENNSSRASRSRLNKPPAGVFEPSSKADELMSFVAIPPTHVNNMDSVLSQLSEKLKGFEASEVHPKPILKLGETHNGRNRPKRVNDSSGDEDKKLKKRKVIRDIRVHVTKLSPSDLVLKKVMGAVKAKSRRRNRINRTGFPVKKKKKKKPPEILVASAAQELILTKEIEKPKSSEIKAAMNELLDVVPVLCVKKVDDIKVNNECEESTAIEVKQESHQAEIKGETPVEQQIKKSQENKMLTATRGDKKLEPAKVEIKVNNKTEETINEGKNDKAKVELRKSSRRLMVLKARQRVEACKRRKRKHNISLVEGIIERDNRSPSPELHPPSPIERNPPEIKPFPSKRLRRYRDDVDKDDSDADSTKSRKKPPPRWRKKYLSAGLFSDCYKEDEPRKNTELCKSRLTYNPAEHKYGLLPAPVYCGKWVRQRKIHFQLPHDLWWLHTNNQLPGRDIVPSWNYKKIRTNVYYDVKPLLLYEAQACSCKVEGEEAKCCGEDCINRMIYTECSPQQCPCADKCSNQKIQRHEWAPGLDKFMTKDKGWGVKTKYAIKNGEFILEYVGEVVSEKEFKNRMASRYQHDTHHYCLNLDGGLVIDGHRMGGDGRFVNHSCEPNCEMQKWSVNGLFRMALFALRDIEPHEELTYDYNFSLFNPAEGQKCKCGSKNCRGVIGGKSQRVVVTSSCGAVGVEEKATRKPRKSSRKRQESQQNKPVAAVVREQKELSQEAIVARLNHLLPLKPLAPHQRAFVLSTRIFLLRNLDKVKQLREKLKLAVRGAPEVAPPPATPTGTAAQTVKESDVFLSQLNALSTPRNIRTRRLAQAQDNPEMTKTARLAHIFRNLYNAIAQAKEEDGELLATPLVTLPSKRKLPQYYQRVLEPIDLTGIEHKIVTGVYKTVESFDQDVCRLFSNNVRFYGRTSDIGIAATRLRKIYSIAKFDFVDQLKEILGDALPATFIPEQEDPGAEEEDVIRCICGMFRDEGLMIQCERCLVWQHCDCVKADTSAEKYLCERCSPRPVDYEIPLELRPDYATEGQTHYMTLLRGDLQLRQGDTVYVLRDIPNEDTGSQTTPPSKHNYKTIKNVKYSDCDIFRIERLWKDEKGNRFAFGHHYLRPHETFHEPTRKFFPNELMRIPLYEVVPLDLIMGHCYVLDINTFCKGRPVGADPQHIYICEYRVDKYARLFAKLAKSKTPLVCLKSYAFEKYDQRLKISRTYTPHGPVKGSSVSRGRGGRSAQDNEDQAPPANIPAPTNSEDEEMPLARRAQQKEALNNLLLRLLARLPSKQPLDLSYLLEPGRRHRKRPAILSP